MQQLKMKLDGEDEELLPQLKESAGKSEMSSSLHLSLEEEEQRIQMLVQAAFQDYDLQEADPISFEQFQDWFSRTPIATQFLDAIRKV